MRTTAAPPSMTPKKPTSCTPVIDSCQFDDVPTTIECAGEGLRRRPNHRERCRGPRAVSTEVHVRVETERVFPSRRGRRQVDELGDVAQKVGGGRGALTERELYDAG